MWVKPEILKHKLQSSPYKLTATVDNKLDAPIPASSRKTEGRGYCEQVRRFYTLLATLTET